MVWLQVLILWFVVGVIAAILFGKILRDPDEADPALDDRRPRDNSGHH